MNKTIGLILIALGVFGLAGEVLRTRPGKRSLTSDRFTLLAKRRTTYRWRLLGAHWL